MKLINVDLNGYKRFQEATRLTVGSKVICIVGPNEAGKSSVLEALLSLELAEFKNTLLTRNFECSDDTQIIATEFLIEEKDVSTLDHLKLEPKPTWFRKVRCRDGTLRYSILGANREKVISLAFEDFCSRFQDIDQSVQEIKDNHALGQNLSAHGNYIFLKNYFETDKNDRKRTEEVWSQARDLATSLLQMPVGDADEPLSLQTLSKFFQEFSVVAQGSGWSSLINHFNSKVKFLAFSEAHRTLHAYQSISSISDQSATSNLIALGGMSWEEIKPYFQTNREKAKELLRGISDKISRYLKSNWTQANLGISIDLDGDNLEINIIDNQHRKHVLDQRSDGFRRFLALIAFVHRYTSQSNDSILLVDEAETHLHLEAQADLIRVLSSQLIVKQVIYTTHSPGCLPEDLTAVRAVEPNRIQGTSRIVRDLWLDQPDANGMRGVQRLLYLAGASTLAFSAFRNAVITEGKTDFILLPKLLRETLERDHLGFQVLPNFANFASLEDASLDAVNIAFLVDGDKAGDEYVEKLGQWGVPKARIFQWDKDLEIEDYISPHIYVEAVQMMLSQVVKEDNFSTKDIIENKSVSKSLEIWCRKQNIKTPGKRTVAQRVIDLASQERIVHPDRLAKVRDIGTLLLAQFEQS